MAETHRIAYVLKMYPRFSETFILNEILELENQGVAIDIFSLKAPDDGRVHADVARARAVVTYVPERLGAAPAGIAAAHRAVALWNPARYQRLAWRALSRRRSGSFRRFSQAVYIAPRLRASGARHVHAHFATSATTVAALASQLTDIPYSFTAHAKDIFHEAVDPRSLRRKIDGARFVVTVSEFNRAFLGQLGDPGRVARIYNGLDVERFRPNGRRPDHDPRGTGGPGSNGDPLVLAVGRLVEKKGFDDLVRACALLKRDGVAFRCRIVGKGERAGRLAQLIQALDVADRVTLAGPLPREELLRLYPRAAVFAAPCVVGTDGNRDGLPTVLIEAMALGVPVVTTPVTGIPELVADGDTGLLVPERDPAALAAALRRVLGDPRLAARLAASGRARVERDFDVRSNVARLRALFLEAAA